MAGTDSVFSAPNSSTMSNGSVGHVVNFGQANDGNNNGDQVVNTEGINKVMNDGFQGTFQKSMKTPYIQYNPNSFYPKS